MSEKKKKVSGNDGGGKGKNRKMTAVVIVLVCIVAVLAVVCVALLLPGQDSEETSTRGTISIIAEEDTAAVEQVEDGYFRCVMTTDWYYTNGMPSNVYVSNSQSNTRDFYFDVYLTDTQELIYSSLVVPVGYDISNFDLDKELDTGVYDAIVTYSFLDDEENVQDMTSFAITITIK